MKINVLKTGFTIATVGLIGVFAVVCYVLFTMVPGGFFSFGLIPLSFTFIGILIILLHTIWASDDL